MNTEKFRVGDVVMELGELATRKGKVAEILPDGRLIITGFGIFPQIIPEGDLISEADKERDLAARKRLDEIAMAYNFMPLAAVEAMVQAYETVMGGVESK